VSDDKREINAYSWGREFMTYRILTASLIWFLFIFSFVHVSHAATPQETLTQYISDLQKNPNDNVLREKIIKYIRAMTPAPQVPAEAEHFEGRAEFAIKSSKTEADFLDAAKEYEKALLLVPWVSAYYFNKGIAYEKGGKFKEAMQSFEFYLIAEPNAKDAKDVRRRIAWLEFAAEKAAKESGPPAIAERPKADLDVSGRWRILEDACAPYFYYEYRLEGDKLYTATVYTDRLIGDPNCEAYNTYRGQREAGTTWTRSGKNEFRFSESNGWRNGKLEFIGDKAFSTSTSPRGMPVSEIFIRER
jgi:tetratricopeptide (TPR) repeat protein